MQPLIRALCGSQKEAVEKLSRLKAGALFLDMGDGKTLAAFELIESANFDLCLWVCPYSIKNEIEAEYSKWGCSFPIKIIGCESIGASKNIYDNILQTIKDKTVFCVVDESLTIKNKNAIRTHRILEIGNHCEYRIILNGTPVTKNYIDLWAQMEFLSHKILNMTYREYKNTFCEYYIRGRLKGFIKKYHNVDYLISLISPYIYSSDLEISVNKNYYNYYYDNNNCEQYDEIKDEAVSSVREGDFNAFSIFTRLQQIYTKSEDKYNIINEITRDGGQYIVYCKFLDNIKGDNKITGELNNDERKAVINRFRNREFNTLWITYGCGSFGLNLQFCHNIIFADQTFDYKQKIQAEGRIYRKGQEYHVNYYNLWCKTGLENMIRASLEKKASLLNDTKKAIRKYGESAVAERL
ncbi:MAG: DEAD/DEAH box helicase [Tannerella sp.]|jgi:SNF2 family DNA or RNA helicase|nr:DEAD/DEAH box helicase [Tannerella sp.]